MFGNKNKQQISLEELLNKIKLPAPVVNVFQPPHPDRPRERIPPLLGVWQKGSVPPLGK